MANQADNTSPFRVISRRSLALAGATLATLGAGGGTALASADTENNLRLRILFAEWEPIAVEYARACAEDEAASDAYWNSLYRVPKRVHEALKGIRIRQVAQEVFDEAYAAGELGTDFKPLTIEQRRQNFDASLSEYLEPGETPEGFLKYCNDEIEKEERTKIEAKATYRVDELSARVQEVIERERDIGERMAAIPAQTLADLGLKLQVAQRISVQALSVSIMEDLRRFTGLPSGVDKYGDDAFLGLVD